MPNKDELNESIVDEFVQNSIDKFVSQFSASIKDTNETHSPLTTARNDIAKTLITLSSSFLALTVTAASGLFSKYIIITGIYFLSLWFFLVITILFGLLSLWMSMNILHMIVQSKEEIFDYVDQIKSLVDKGSDSIASVIKNIHLPYEKANTFYKWSRIYLLSSFASFFASMIIFLCIGWISISFSSHCAGSNLKDSMKSNATYSDISSADGNTGCPRPSSKQSIQKRL
jgi:hypothetical protein